MMFAVARRRIRKWRRAVDGERSEPAIGLAILKMPRKSPRKRLRVRVDDKNRLDGKETLTGLLIDSC
jgi:hypothetical protein